MELAQRTLTVECRMVKTLRLVTTAPGAKSATHLAGTLSFVAVPAPGSAATGTKTVTKASSTPSSKGGQRLFSSV